MKHLLIICLFCYAPFSAYAAPFTVTSDNQTVAVDDDFLFTEIISSFAGTAITVDTISSSNGVIASGSTTPAISIEDSGSLASLTIDSGTVSSENTDSSSGTVSLIGDSGTSPIINVGKNSGTSGTIDNSGVGGNAIYAESASTTLTINNKATGTISSAGNAIKLNDVLNSSSVTLNNAGTITAADGYKAISLSGYYGEITNSGTITGDIDLGSTADSSITLNGGTIAGNITMGNASQITIFSGGNLDNGTINGSGATVRVDVDTVLSGSIGNDNAIGLLNISSNADFSLASNSFSINADKVTLATNASITSLYDNLSTAEIDGSSSFSGTLNLNFSDNSTIGIATLLGTTNGLSLVNISGNLSDTEKASDITLLNNINATITIFTGLGSTFELASNNIISGAVVIGNDTILELSDASSIGGTIRGDAQYHGDLKIISSGTPAVSAVVLNNDIGDSNTDLHSIIGEYNTSIDAATNNVTINAQNIYLSNLANLIIGSGSINGTIQGFTESGSSNGFGDVVFADNNTLGGNVGTSSGNALNSITINSNIAVTAGSYEINAKNISVGVGASLTTSSLISGGDNDDAGATLSNAAISLDTAASLILNADSSIYATIDSTDSDTSITINGILDATNSLLNIGDNAPVGSLTISDNASLDVGSYSGKVNANAILLGDGATLKISHAEIGGTINGLTTDDSGTFDIQGNATLSGEIGGTNSLHLLNIGIADDGYIINAAESITATNVTINGDSSSLILSNTKAINGDVTISGDAELSLGNGSAVNGTIVGAEQYQGFIIIRDGATFSAGGNIGAGDLDLAEIAIHGTFDLSGLSAYEAHAQTFSLTSGTSLVIGSGIIEGDIKGFADDGGTTDGFGKGSVSFVTNLTDPTTTFLVTKIGSDDGHAIAELSVSENLTVDTGNADISAERITLYSGASLTSSASELNGGNQIYGGFSRLSSQITLNDGASLTLDNVNHFMGTIDGNAAGQGDLIITGSYIYDDGDDVIDIGTTNKLASITLTDSSTLDVSRWDGVIKADAITLNNLSQLTIGGGDIVGTIDGDEDDHGTLNVLSSNDFEGEIGGTHSILALNIGYDEGAVGIGIEGSIHANTVNIGGAYTSVDLDELASITGNVFLGANAMLNLSDGAYVSGEIQGAAQYEGQLIITNDSTVVAHNNIGDGDLDLALVIINNGATLNLNTNDVSLNSLDISLLDDSTLIIGSKTVTGEILGYNSEDPDLATYGIGKGTVSFQQTNSLNDDIGDDSGNAINSIIIAASRLVDAGSFSLYTSNISLGTNATLESAGIIGGGIDETADHQIASAITLDTGATLSLSSGASILAAIDGNAADGKGIFNIGAGMGILAGIDIGATFKLATVHIATSSILNLDVHDNALRANLVSLENDATLTLGSGSLSAVIDGFADYNGIVNVADSATFGSNVTFGSTHGLEQLNLGNSGGATFGLNSSIKASTLKIIGSGSTAIVADSVTINGNVVLDGDSTLSLGDGSVVNGSITNLSNSSPNGSLIIREGAVVETNGEIGGNGYNFYSVVLNDSSHLDLSTHNNSINSSLVNIAADATLTIGTATINSDIIGHSSTGGSDYGLGKVIFADSNTIGGYVGGDVNGTLESVTIASGKIIDGGSHRINALDIILNDGATLSSSELIGGGVADGDSVGSNTRIQLGDGAILKLSDGATVVGTIDGDDENHGQLQILSGTIYAQANIGNTYALEDVSLTGGNLNLSYNNSILKAANVYLSDDTTLTIGTNSVTGNISGYADSGSNNGLGNVVFAGATNSLAANIGGHNDNALDNVTINNSFSVAAGSHEINASTITLNANSTIITSGAISGGADITGATPIATAITLHTNASLILNNGASIFGTIDGSQDNEGLIEFAANYTTNGNIGSNFKLAEVYVDNGITLDLGTNNNSLRATTVYIGTASTLYLGAGGTVDAAIASLTTDTGVLYIDNSTTFNSGSTLGGETGLLSIYIDNTAAGSVLVDSQDDIKARNINVDGDASYLSLATNKTITGNVNLGDGSSLILNDNSSVTGTIDGADDSEGILEIASGTFITTSNIGNGHNLDSVILDTAVTLDLSQNDNILKADNITLGSASNFIIGSGDVVGAFLGASDGNGTITFSKNFTLAAGSTIGNNGTSQRIAEVVVNEGVTLTQNENIAAFITAINGETILGANKRIDGGNVYVAGSLTLNSHSVVGAGILGVDSAGDIIINTNADVTSSNYIGGDDDQVLASVTLKSGSTLNLQTNNNSISATNIILNDGSTLNIGTSSINGTIKGNTNGKGSVNFYNNNALGGDVGASEFAVNDITIDDSVTGNTVDTQGHAIYASNDIILGSKANLITSSSITAAGITMSNDSTLTLTDGATINAAVNAVSADSAGIGTILVSGTVTLNGSIGDLFKIKTLTIEDDATLDVSANNNSVNVTNIELTGTLTIGTTTFNSAIDGESDDYGILNIASGKTATSYGNIGAGESLHEININSGAILDLATNDNTLNATATNISSGATLNVGSGDIIGTFSGDGAINFNNSKTSSGTIATTLGTTDSSLGTVTIANGVNLEFVNSIYANQINIGTSGASATSLTLTLSGTKVIAGDTQLADNATLEITNSGFLETGAIYGATNGVGTLNLSGSGSLTLNGDIGDDDYALSSLSLGEGYFINAHTNNASVVVNDIYLAANSGIIIANGELSGTVHGSGDGDSISFTDGTAHTLSGNLGSASDDAGIDSISLGGLLDVESNEIRTNEFILDSAYAFLIFGSGNIDIGTFTNNYSGDGIINFTATNNINFAIDADNEIAELRIADGATVTANQLINATYTSIGGGTSGKLILAADQTLVSDVQINSGANLTLNNNSEVSGEITGDSTSGSGTLEIAASASVTASGNIGTADNKISAITLNANSTFNVGDQNIVATTASLASGATLQIDSGSLDVNVIGSSNGNGSLIFTENNSLLKNIGNSNHKIAEVIINDSATLVSSKGIYANNVKLGSSSTLELQNGSFVSNTINGSANGNGDINASGTVSFGAIGTTNSINNFTTTSESSATFNGNIFAAGDININGAAIFSNASTSINANSFNVNSGSTLSFSINLNSAPTSVLEVAGAALISANTNLNLTISGNLSSGESITLVNASAPSTINAIEDAKINLNNSGTNILNGQTYSTLVFENELLLTVLGDFTPDSINFSNSNLQNSYNAIVNASDATGNLAVVKSYLTNAGNSIAQKEEVLKSVTTQVDNSNNRLVFDNVNANANLISARLNNMRSGIASGDVAKNKGMWFQAFGSSAHQGNTSVGDGYNATSSGMAFGMDREVADDLIFGMGASYSHSNINGRNSSKKTYIDGYQLSLYSSYSAEKFFLNTSISAAVNEYKSSRYISIAHAQAGANYSGNSYSARAEIGTNFKLKNEIIFTPTFTVTAAKNYVDSYSESGGGNLNLHTSKDSANFFETRVGGEISRSFKIKSGEKIRPQFSISYGYDFAGNKQKATNSFIGQNVNFANSAAKVAQGSLRIGTGVDFFSLFDTTFSANYTFEYRDNYDAHTGWLKAKYNF